MTKRVLVIPDDHGRIFWGEPVKKYLETADNIMFLSDSNEEGQTISASIGRNRS